MTEIHPKAVIQIQGIWPIDRPLSTHFGQSALRKAVTQQQGAGVSPPVVLKAMPIPCD